MIVDAKPPVHYPFELPTDAPPAYDDIGPASSSQVILSGPPPPPPPPRNTSLLRPRTLRSAHPTGPQGISNTTSPSTLPGPFLPDKSLSVGLPPPARRDKLKPGPLTPKAQADVRETICGLIRDVVQGSSSVRSSALDAIAVLDSCAAACASHQLSLARILQEKSIEGHAPIYWAIVSRPISNEGPRKGDHREDDAFLVSLLTRASPLRPIAVSELRAGCLVASSNALFHRLRSAHSVTTISGTDRMLLANSNTSSPSHVGPSSPGKKSEKKGGKDAPLVFGDIAEVREGGKGSDAEWFGVDLRLKIFQRRMRVSGNVSVEFIARGRLWQLIFFVVPPLPSKDSPPKTNPYSPPSTPSNVPRAAIDAARALSVPPGSWALCLALLEGSAQCYAEARLLVNEPSSNSPDVWRDLPPAPGRSQTVSDTSNTVLQRPRPQHPRQSSEPQQQRSSIFSSLFNRRSGSDNVQPKSHQPRPPIMISLSSVGSSPLLALPPLSSSYFAQLASSEPLPDEVDLSIDPKKKKRPSREEKRAARKAVKKERRAECGKETRKEKKERARVAETVLVAGLEEVPCDAKKNKNKESTTGWSKGGELIGCPFITPDGTLHAILEARLSISPPESYNDSDCVIC
ncbi:uncharacterized protein FOMMEDRAFT_161361 [Fomitiporia mediterranea MF3/22]|uniref:uncharacterized protein n=1 Tax=Fomitiporia mediterranea (strain MF3/22) TaxID=694068 RepID=UPI00044075FD|nr:uncharacterized protein FOMMEDRAFT_161361 [Fomitiporia mediterranea MF3/22]EJC98547.1 hypothetical protein FOMMEDRAFT_161361 [Fomitiporia mediterranea MF3/22]